MKSVDIRRQGRCPFSGRMIALGVLLALILGWLLYTVPINKEISFTYEGVEWDFKTNELIDSADITMEGTISYYLFQPDHFSGTLEVEGFVPCTSAGTPVQEERRLPVSFDLNVYPHVMKANLYGKLCGLQRKSDGRKIGRLVMPPDFPDSVLLSIPGENVRYIAAPAKDAAEACEIWERTHGVSYLSQSKENPS